MHIERLIIFICLFFCLLSAGVIGCANSQQPTKSSPSHADALVEPPADAHGVPTAGGGAADGRETHVFVHVRSAVCTRDALVVGRLC